MNQENEILRKNQPFIEHICTSDYDEWLHGLHATKFRCGFGECWLCMFGEL